jgi:RNA polymerase sigma-70 factor (ECF subfamily)
MTNPALARAQAGDGDAFQELVGPYRRELHAHCYRFLGSFQDAEDVLQETLLSAWQGLGRFDGQSLRAWLYRIATNRCLNHLRAAARRPPPANLPESTYPLDGAARSDDPWWLEAYPDTLIEDISPGPEARYDARESIALSFVAGLQHLPARQRAALVLRDVLGFSAAEAAEILGSTPASVNSALQRARSGFRPAGHWDRVTLPRSGQEAEVVGRFVDAYEGGDVGGLVALLTQDARVTMPPDPYEFSGRRAVADHVRQTVGFWGQGLKLVPTRANHQPAVGYYLPDPTSGVHRAGGLLVLTVSQDRICAITRFADRSLLTRFGLPSALPSS